jgi:hypothetical protein
MSELNTVNMTATEIDNLKCDTERKLKVAQAALSEVELQELELSKSICELQLRRKGLQIAISKAKHIVRQLSLDIKIQTSEFWRAKDNR